MSAAAPITRETLARCTKRVVMHVKLARGGVMVEWQCNQHPRLRQHVYRGTREAKLNISYSVDGQRCTDLVEALRFLNGPVVPADLFEVASA